jgi:hypothetical protein
MQEALAATPGRGAAAHARRYFGKEADAIFADAAELAGVLSRYLNNQYQLDGLLEWLTATGFGNDYRMIKVFSEWAKLRSGPMRWRVRYYYLATGMEGRPDEEDFGVVEAPSVEAAKDSVAQRKFPVDIMYGPNNRSSSREFFRAYLIATAVDG